MLHLFYVALSLLLSLQFVIADSTSFPRHSKASSLEKQSLLSALLVRRGKFNVRAGDACPSGYQPCANYPGVCAPNGYYCCNSAYTCPNGDTCVGSTGDACCSSNSQTCGGTGCCDAGSECCKEGGCCDLGDLCCNDSVGGCCPSESTCVTNTSYCSYSSGGGGSSTGAGPAGTTTTSTSLSSIVQSGTTSVSITSNGPTTPASSSSLVSSNTPDPSSSSSSTLSPSTTTVMSPSSTISLVTPTGSVGLPAIGAAAPGIVLTPGRQLAFLAAVVGVPILHNAAHIL